MIKKQNGFTIVELMFVVMIIVCIVILGTLGFVGTHFINKFW